MDLSFVNEKELVDHMFEHLKKVPLVIQIRNADLTVGTTRITGSADISIGVGEVLGQ